MGERVRLRPDRTPEPPGSARGLAFLFVLVGTALLFRSWWTPTVPAGLLVQVHGEVAAPGTYLVDPPTLAAAVEAAGGLSEGVPETPLFPGDAVAVGLDGARVLPGGRPLLVALPVDINTHGVEALAAVPGLGRTRAEAVVASRVADGLYFHVGDLTRVAGLGPDTVEAITPFITLGDVGYRPPVDINTADAEALQSLPGIGAVLAERIVADRQANGPYARLEDLARVSGIGPGMVRRLREHAVVTTP